MFEEITEIDVGRRAHGYRKLVNLPSRWSTMHIPFPLLGFNLEAMEYEVQERSFYRNKPSSLTISPRCFPLFSVDRDLQLENLVEHTVGNREYARKQNTSFFQIPLRFWLVFLVRSPCMLFPSIVVK